MGTPLSYAAAGAADSLKELIAQKYLEQRQRQMLAQSAQRMQQEDAYRRDSLASMQGARDDAAAARKFAQEQATAQQQERSAAQATAGNQATLRAAIQGSQNVAGTGDPNGAIATRNALRVALTSSGAKPNEIPQEAIAPKPKLYPVTVPGQNGQPMHKLASEDEMQQGVQGYRPPAAPAQARGLTPNAESQLTTKLAADWQKVSAPAREMDRQFDLMKTGLQRFRQGDKNGGSQAVLVTFQKILDPNSVVRESEYARSAEGVSLLQRIQGYAERLKAGGAGVPEGALQEMVKTAEQFTANSRRAAEGQRKRLGAFADKYGIPQELVFDDGGGAKPTAAPDGGGKSVTMQQLQAIAQKRGTSVEQEKQRAAAEGFIVR